ncbi:MAG: carbohydrate-binding protein [Bacillota bacterium]
MSIWDNLFTNNIETSPIISESISIEPDAPQIGEEVRIKYDGMLAQNGASQVYLHIGYDDNWHDLEDIPMERYTNGWYCNFVPEEKEMNFCFHDSANNWDNNNGQNWSLIISE